MLSTDEAVLRALHTGALTVQGEFLWGSNYTYLAQIQQAGATYKAVYKPTRGERPLWDFPTATLARREVAAYQVAKGLSWGFVPPTVYREQAPAGPGSVQLFIDHNPDHHYFNFSQRERQRLRKVAIFDILINNADRKGSHLLIAPDNSLWLIDHGICFHVEDKLRTVVWDFAGEGIPDELCSQVFQFRKDLERPSELVQALEEYLNPIEIEAMAGRIDRLMATGKFPNPHPNRRHHPWPPI